VISKISKKTIPLFGVDMTTDMKLLFQDIPVLIQIFSRK